MLKITVIVENKAALPLAEEHGLSMLAEYKGNRLFFDFGASSLWQKNAALLNINISDVPYAFLSHGHNDHTGGLQFFNGEIFCTSNINAPHFSRHQGKPVKNLAMPPAGQDKLNNSVCHFADEPSQILNGIFSTGKIPRITFEDCGGPFFIDEEKNAPDLITNESALLFDNGVLVHGCCHSGIINTLEHCRKVFPDIKIHTIVGGLHLLHADEKRLELTAEYLEKSNIEKLYLMHCTGDNAVDFLRKKLVSCNIFTPRAGDILTF